MRFPTTPACAAFAAVLLLSSCAAATTEPDTEPEPTVLEVATVDGDWVATRTVTSSTVPSLEVGDVETRYVVISEAECDEAACSGSFLSAKSEDIFEQGEDTEGVAPGAYEWDGTSLTLTFDDSLADCTNNETGAVVAEDVYTQQSVYALEASEGDDPEVAVLAGSYVVRASLTGNDPGGTCPDEVAAIDYDAELVRR